MEPAVTNPAKPRITVAEARDNIARLSDPNSYDGHPSARTAVWREAKEAILQAKARPGFLIIANDNTGDAA
jgi:hypothetical protein